MFWRELSDALLALLSILKELAPTDFDMLRDNFRHATWIVLTENAELPDATAYEITVQPKVPDIIEAYVF